jgi:mannose-6-phosphate isomerase-like protein (cupin superfamily)
MSKGIRRVVTGHDVGGKAVIASDEVIAGATSWVRPGDVFHRLWGWDVAPTLPDDGSQSTTYDFYPPNGGARFVVITLGPDSMGTDPPRVAVSELAAEFARLLPGAAQYVDRTAPRFHRTPTVDLAVVLSGRVTIELDSGDRATLSAGDTLVQNGTSHTWINVGPESVQIGLVMTGVSHSAIPSRHP